MKKLLLILLFFIPCHLYAENGYDLWLRYKKITDPGLLNKYRQTSFPVFVVGQSPVTRVIKDELEKGLTGLLDKKIICNSSSLSDARLIILTSNSTEFKNNYKSLVGLSGIKYDGYLIQSISYKGKQETLIVANTDQGLLYGAFRFLQLMQMQQPLSKLNIVTSPKLKLRLLNHWDNLDRTVERGYAGFSLWNWHTLPGLIDQRYIDYARANASIGINGTVLTNVNANATILTRPYLEKVKALADIFRPYGIKVYLTARFSAPIEAGGLKTADPLNDSVRTWWNDKAKEIYSLIPDFGGFLVKANSEGQPGPQNYNRTHADGANMLADAVAPYNGIVMWRAFVYSAEVKEDRHKQAYNEFMSLDGKFRPNVIVQVKNGAIDFQPREPFHPLFGAMQKTPLMMEFQLTQEYLGQATNLAYLAPMYKECLESDTYRPAKGSTVARVIDGTSYPNALTGMAGVANTGNDVNWCGHPFAAANWYAYGQLAWDHGISSEKIADEWIRMTFSNDASFISSIKKMMLVSREVVVRYMTPLGLHHLMGTGHHYGPAPWVSNLNRPDWNPVYYHRADSIGLGFDRTTSGSGALAQYAPEIRREWENASTIPEKYLLWFHHVPWKQSMKSGRTLWDELCYQYDKGVEDVRQMQRTWEGMKSKIDSERFEQVKMLLSIQEKEAVWWRNACLLYFQQFSKLPMPSFVEQPNHTLDFYKSLQFPYAPGN